MNVEETQQAVKSGYKATLSFGHDHHPGASGTIVEVKTNEDGETFYRFSIETIVMPGDLHGFRDANGTWHDVESWH